MLCACRNEATRSRAVLRPSSSICSCAATSSVAARSSSRRSSAGKSPSRRNMREREKRQSRTGSIASALNA